MKKYNHKFPLISIHIPKCGGSSFLAILQQWFGTNLHLHYFNEKKAEMPVKLKYKNWITGGTQKDSCIHGHFNHQRKFGVDDYYPKLKQAITFLRDPLEIQLSEFYYNHKLLKSGKLFRDGKKINQTDDVDEYLEKSNPSFKFFLPKKMTTDKFEWYLNNYFVHIGIMEDYQNSIDILAHKLQKPPATIGLENKSARFSTPSQSSVEKFKIKCEFEYSFYQFALEQHQKELISVL